jgi:hypothetical protein
MSSCNEHGWPSGIIAIAHLVVPIDFLASTGVVIQNTKESIKIMKTIFLFLTILASAAAFAPQTFGVRQTNT